MWSEVLSIINRVAGASCLNCDEINAALGVELTTIDNPAMRRYQAEMPSGPFRKVELREVPATGVAFLTMRANEDRPIVVPYDGLKQFGPRKGCSTEPRSPPEGSVAERYDLGDKELRIGYGAMTRMLEVVSLGTAGYAAG